MPLYISFLLSGTYKTEYKTNESLDTNGMVLTATYTDGSVKNIAPEDCAFEGFDTSKSRGDLRITVKIWRRQNEL